MLYIIWAMIAHVKGNDDTRLDEAPASSHPYTP